MTKRAYTHHHQPRSLNSSLNHSVVAELYRARVAIVVSTRNLTNEGPIQNIAELEWNVEYALHFPERFE